MHDACGGGDYPASVDAEGAVPDVRPSGLTNSGRVSTLRDVALSLVDGDRQDAYGEPVAMHTRLAEAWSAVFGWDVDAHKAALAMVVLKAVREAYQPNVDNRVDGIGYWQIVDRCADNETVIR